jgi:glyoxylase-like metal-dependent hydrolase (beta-lactamase superfamily II)
MIFEKIVSGSLGNNCYLLGCSTTKQAVVIDPAEGSFSKVFSKKEKLSLTIEEVLITHSHFDHIEEAFLFKKELSTPVWIHKLDAKNLEKPGSDEIFSGRIFPAVKADHFLEDGEKFFVGTIVFEVIHTPGHSPGSICFYLPQEKILFSGDTLFRGGMGSISLPTADAKKMRKSLERLAKLPKDTVVFPGHGPKTTIGEESWLFDLSSYFSH